MTMEKINVLFIVDKLTLGGSKIHGVTQLFARVIPRFNQDRYRVSVVSLRPPDQGVPYLEENNIRVLNLSRGKFNPLTLADLMQLVKKEDAHILHLHGYGATTFGRLCSKLTGIPCIVHEHMYDKTIPFYQRAADKLLSGATTHSIAVSESVKDFLVRYRGVPTDKVDVIYYGISIQAFNSENGHNGSHQKLSCKAQLNIPEDHLMVSIVGRLHPIKGHTFFLQAAQRVLKDFKKVTFVVVGDGELLPALQEEAKQLGIERNVVFTGYFEDLAAILAETDIKVISSLSEGIPFTLYEAMAAKCAIVSADVGGIGEVVKNGEAGFLVPPQNPSALAEKILVLLKDSQLREKMAAEAFRVSQKYEINNTVNQIEGVYEQLTNGK